MSTAFDDIFFCLEIPGLRASLGPEKFWDTIKKNQPLIDRVGEFLEKNGAVRHFPTDRVCYGFGVTDLPHAEDPKTADGVSFEGTLKLAQALADAFPAYKVWNVNGGKVVPPARAAAPKAARPQSGPRP